MVLDKTSFVAIIFIGNCILSIGFGMTFTPAIGVIVFGALLLVEGIFGLMIKYLN